MKSRRRRRKTREKNGSKKKKKLPRAHTHYLLSELSEMVLIEIEVFAFGQLACGHNHRLKLLVHLVEALGHRLLRLGVVRAVLRDRKDS